MVGPAYDCLSNPLGAVRICFDKAGAANAAVLHELSDGDFGVKELFRRAVIETGSLAQLPEINSLPLDAIPVNSLVRYRGMVQDMFDVEYYVGAYKDGNTWKTNKYSDAAILPACSDSDMQIWERRPYYCVPVPGENSWVKNVFATRGFQANGSSASANAHQSQKRTRETCPPEGISLMQEMDEDLLMEVESGSGKRVCNGHASSSGPSCQQEGMVELNMPLGEKNLAPCLVKVYDTSDGDLKLNDVVEFIGVFTFDPDLTRPGRRANEGLDNTYAAFLEEDVSSRLPASKVPRLHCLLHRKLSGHKLLSSVPDYEPALACHEISPLQYEELRKSLVDWLTQVLAGDDLLAEYLLLHLISQVYVRVEPMAVGKLSLNICDWNETSMGSNLTTSVSQAIADLLPCSHLMPLSLEQLNRSLFAPRKNYSTNRLTTGALQLADGTHLILDETAMASGQLTEIGLRNVHFLRNLMEWQKVEYDFEFYKMDMPADIPVLVLSSAKSRLFPADVIIPFRPTVTYSCPLLDQPQVSSWRFYLNAAKSKDHAIEPCMQKILEDDLVNARQDDRSLGPEVFHRWLTLARLLSISYGDSTLTMERWQMVRELERRLSQRKAG